MTSRLFDLPIELRSHIFSSFSLRDISRLRQCCSTWKNNLQDLSFMKVLDFSYSPDITEEDFNNILSHRINKQQNNISRIIIAHTKNITESWLPNLLQVLPRITSIRISRVLDVSCIPILLQQEHLESIDFKYEEGMPTVRYKHTLPVKCTKLTRFNIRTINLHETFVPVCDLKTLLKLLEMNPALKNDVNFLEYAVWEVAGAEMADGSKVLTTDGNDISPIVDAFFALNDLRLYKNALEYRGPLNMNYGMQILHRTLDILRAMSAEQLQSSKVAHEICINLLRQPNLKKSVDEDKKLIVQNLSLLDPIADLYSAPSRKDRLNKLLEKIKKRPFSYARRSYLFSQLHRLSTLASNPTKANKYRDELYSTIAALAPILKKIPRQLRLLKASWLIRCEEFHAAFEEYMGIIDPNKELCSISAGNRLAQGYLGAYHVAKDYIKSPELLQRLKAVNPENFEFIESALSDVQPKLAAGKCTNDHDEDEYLMQYHYTCYSCFGSELTPKELCYSCIRTCHQGADHVIAYVQTKNFYCCCPKCNASTLNQSKWH